MDIFQFHLAEQNPAAETAHVCFFSICYKCNMGAVGRPWYGLSQTITILQLLPITQPYCSDLFCHWLNRAYSIQTYSPSQHKAWKTIRQTWIFNHEEFLLPVSDLQPEQILFNNSYFFSIPPPTEYMGTLTHIHSFACLLKQDCCMSGLF